MTNRLEILKSLAAQNPSDNFTRYSLATEFAKAGRLEEAVAEFRALLAMNPDYAAAYYQAGQVLEQLGKTDEAREMYRQGIEVTTRQGNPHACEQLQLALDLLG